jgi:penicillin amidase
LDRDQVDDRSVDGGEEKKSERDADRETERMSTRLPVPAWDEANHWRGRLESYYLPRIYDPPEGFIATANENINERGGPLLVTMPVPDYRKRRIVERLCEFPAATVSQMEELQYDVVSLQARELLAVFLPHIPEGPIRHRLAAWDCSYHPGSLEATLFTKLYRNVLLEIFGEAPNPEGGGIGWRRKRRVLF